MNSTKAMRRDERTQKEIMDEIWEIIKEEGLETKFFHALVERNGHKIVRCNECLAGHEYMSVFAYSEKHGGTIDSFRYYNYYVVDVTEQNRRTV